MQKSIQTLLAAGLVAAASLPAAAQHGSGTVAPAPRAAGGSTNITVTNDDGSTVQLTMRGDEVTAFVDGKRVPEDRIERDDKTIKILGEDGEVLREFNVGSGGGVWTVDGAGRLAERSIVVGDGTPRAFMGVTLGDLDETTAAQMKLDPGQVVTITTVTPGQPAEKAGLRAHDIVVRVNGQGEASAEALRKVIASKKPGETLELRVLRGGEEEDVEITLGEAPQMNAYAFSPSAGGQWQGHLEDAEGAWKLSMEQMHEQLAHGQEAWEEAMNRLSEEWENLDLSLSDEDRAKLEEALARVRESLENLDVEIDMPRVRFFGDDGRRAVVVPPAPAAPGAPAAPPAGTYRFVPQNAATAESDERLKKIEERMDRIEALLQRLAEKE